MSDSDITLDATDVSVMNLEDAKNKAKSENGEVYSFRFRTVEKPLTIPERKERIIALQQKFDSLASQRPDATDKELRDAIVSNEATVSTDHKSLYTFITDTHPRMCRTIMTRRRDPRVMPNIMRMLAVRQREKTSTKKVGDELVSSLQNQLFNECLTDALPTTHYNAAADSATR